MTPDKKAKELVEKIFNVQRITIAGTSTIWLPLAKQVAGLWVDEIQKRCRFLDWKIGRESPFTEDEYNAEDEDFSTYWNEVKDEIEKIKV